MAVVRASADSSVRNNHAHIDERVLGGGTIISSTIFEGDLLGSTDAKGELKTVEVSRRTLAAVADALDTIVWSPEALARLRSGKALSTGDEAQ